MKKKEKPITKKEPEGKSNRIPLGFFKPTDNNIEAIAEAIFQSAEKVRNKIEKEKADKEE